MVRNSFFKIFMIALISLTSLTPVTFADDLVYAGQAADGTNSNNPNIQGASSPALAVNYGNNAALYGASGQSVTAYSNFFASPYSSGGLSQEYFSPTQGAAMAAGAAGSAQANSMPHVSEVNPLGQYSPYMEIVGEGSDYKLGIDDVVTIMVRNQPDFSGRFIVNPEGKIQYNYVGDVEADGKTKDELKADLIEKLKKFVRYPEVAVMISDYRSKSVYVFGFVNQPGKYAMKGNKITVKEAIVAAGLVRMDGSLKNVYVVRPSDKNKDQKAWQKKIDLDQLLIKGNAAEDFLLEPGDTVVVNQKYFDRFINAYSKILGPVFQSAAVYELAYGNKTGGFLKSSKK